MTGSAPKRIFISYSRRDGAEFAAKLREELEVAGLPVWHDVSALEGNRDWWSQIEEALRSKELHHLVLVLTPAAVASQYVRDEIRLARQEGKTVSPVKGAGLDLAAVPRWMGHAYDLDIPDQCALLMRVLAGPGTQARVPMMAPEPPADFVQRPAEFGALQRKLLDAKGDAVAITAALRGAGGYGKTTLARALAHDPDIQDAYFDGILWGELGEKPANLLSIISDLIETITGARPGLENLNAAAAKLGEALGDRRILLIIDDAWRERDLRPFLQGGRNTTRLITTRRDDILPLKAERQTVDAMRAGEALALLASGLPEVQAAAQRPALEALAARLGEWAQLLKLVNGFLGDRVVKGHQALDQAIAGVNKRLTEKGLNAFSARDEADRSKAIAKTIGVSLDLLSESERARFAELAVFPEDVDAPIGVAARLWAKTGGLDEADTEDLLVRLESLSLLLSLDLGRRSFRFHDTVRHFLQEQAGKDELAALHKTLLEAMEGAGTEADEAVRRYYYLYRPAHFAAAGERASLDALLEDPGWLQAKLNALESPQSLIADFEQFGQGRVQDLVGRTLRLTSGICARDKRQLLPQLHGRLMTQAGTAPFCAAARQLAQRPALLTSRSSLTLLGVELARFEGHGAPVNALAVLPDGRLASGSWDMTIRLWNLKMGAKEAKLESHGDSVLALAVLPGGRLASGSWAMTIRFWDPRNGTKEGRLEGHGGPVNVLVVLPDGRLVSGSDDNTIRLWDLSTYAEVATFKGHVGSVKALAALRNGRFASGASDKTIRIWDLETAKELAKLEGHGGPVNALAALSDGRLASGSDDNSIRLWDLKNNTEASKFEGHSGSVNALALLRDGRLASASDDNTIALWDLTIGTKQGKLEGHVNPVNALAALPDGRLASGSGKFSGTDNTVRLWDPKTDSKEDMSDGHAGPLRALVVLPDGRLASGSADKTIRLWELKTAQELAVLKGHGRSVTSLAVLSDGHLASGSADGTIRLWNPKTGAEVARFDGRGGVKSLAVLPNGHIVFGNQWHITILTPMTLAKAAELCGHDRLVTALVVLPDGGLASGSDDETIRIWDLKTNAEVARLTCSGGPVNALAVLPDGGLASGSDDEIIRIWDFKTGSEVARFEGHRDWVNTLAVLADGRLASGSDDKTIRLWDLNRGAEITRLEVDAGVESLVTLPDGRLVAGDALGRLHWLEILE
jgi:WD40 repeat protein